MKTNAAPAPNRSGIFERAAANLEKLKAATERRETEEPGRKELEAAIAEIERKGREKAATSAATTTAAISPAAAPKVENIAAMARPRDRAAFNAQLNAITDPAKRGAFYAEHASSFGLETPHPAGNQSSESRPSMAQFNRTLAAFDDANERGAYYARWAPQLGL